MKRTYPIILIPEKEGFTVYIPDFDINTEGKSLAEAIEMARDAIGLMGIDMEDDQKPLPIPTELCDVERKEDELTYLVDVDFEEYRHNREMRDVKKIFRSEAQKAADKRYAEKIKGQSRSFAVNLKLDEYEQITVALKKAGLSKADFLRWAVEKLQKEKL